MENSEEKTNCQQIVDKNLKEKKIWNQRKKKMSKPTNLSDQELKDHGNKLFAARKFEDAISCYSKAIVSFPSWDKKESETWNSVLSADFLTTYF